MHVLSLSLIVVCWSPLPSHPLTPAAPLHFYTSCYCFGKHLHLLLSISLHTHHASNSNATIEDTARSYGTLWDALRVLPNMEFVMLNEGDSHTDLQSKFIQGRTKSALDATAW